MECVILCGIQASGKTTFYNERFAGTHVRVSLDELKTRARERSLIQTCLATKQPYVVDNTNVTRDQRASYVGPAHAAGFRVVCYFFATDAKAAFARNRQREGKAAVPAGGLFGTAKRLQLPTIDEGFDALFTVEVVEPSGFRVTARD